MDERDQVRQEIRCQLSPLSPLDRGLYPAAESLLFVFSVHDLDIFSVWLSLFNNIQQIANSGRTCHQRARGMRPRHAPEACAEGMRMREAPPLSTARLSSALGDSYCHN